MDESAKAIQDIAKSSEINPKQFESHHAKKFLIWSLIIFLVITIPLFLFFFTQAKEQKKALRPSAASQSLDHPQALHIALEYNTKTNEIQELSLGSSPADLSYFQSSPSAKQNVFSVRVTETTKNNVLLIDGWLNMYTAIFRNKPGFYDFNIYLPYSTGSFVRVFDIKGAILWEKRIP